MSRNGTAQLNAFIWVLILLLVVIMCVEIAGLVLHGAPTPTSRSPRGAQCGSMVTRARTVYR